jgi:uncharacterized protein YciI
LPVGRFRPARLGPPDTRGAFVGNGELFNESDDAFDRETAAGPAGTTKVSPSVAEHHILLYDYVDDILERRGPYREAHLARIRARRESGQVVMAGALGEPPHGAAIVFRGPPPEAIEAFARADPYVEAGLVTAWRVEPWNVV